MNGALRVDTIKWHLRTMELRGSYYWNDTEPVVATIAYAHVAATQLMKDGLFRLAIVANGAGFELHFQCESNARDAAAELHRRMEAVT